MKQKINVALLFGGKSVEHEVSIMSAKNVAAALDPQKYQIHYIGIDKEGSWHQLPNLKEISCEGKKGDVKPIYMEKMDVVFPIMHGPLGEDGTVQGLLRLANIPFVGADVLGSAIGMDKDVAKRLVSYANIPTARWLTFYRHEKIEVQNLNFPLFVKPADGGSSIGINKVKTVEELDRAISEAFEYSNKILIEEMVNGRELQVAVMGNEHPKASLPCEIIPKGEFHTYSSKYIDQTAAEFLYPAPLSSEEIDKIQKTALKVYKILCAEGMGRVDFFLDSSGKLFFNEINTIPGLTNMSPYAKMWQVSGVSYREMLDQLIMFAIERHQKQQQLKTQIAWSEV